MSDKLAFVFPGQGSQSVGMLGDLGSDNPIILDTFREASQVLNYDLWELTQQGPSEELNQTAVTQPALLTASVALWRLWCEKSTDRPVKLAGHSLGEYSALVCAGSLAFQDAVKLVEKRGQLMQKAVPEGVGGMAAILGLSDDQVRTLCEANSTDDAYVAPANYNSLGQIVISGHRDAVLKVMDLAKEQGAKRVLLLPVSVPSHCLLMKKAAELFSETLQQIEFNVPSIPVIHNVDVSEHQDAQEIRQALVEQLYQPVRWVETVRLMETYGITAIVECGPGAVLSGLNKRITAVGSRSLSNGEFVCP